jgi:DNA modification methylase
MKIEQRDINAIRPYDKNPRINDAAVDSVARSIEEFGFRQPIVVDEDGVIIVGHTRWKAAQKLGWKKVPVHVAAGLTPAQIKAYRIADNQTATIADWDTDLLSVELDDLRDLEFDLDLLGFEDDELEKLLDGMDGSGEVVEDEVPEPPAEPVTQPGDLWLLGEHRLLCGDSTKAEDVGRVMGGEKADLVFTDPPYGMAFQSNMRTASEKFEVIANDDKVLIEWIPRAIEHSKGWVFVWTTWKVLDQWMPAVKPFGRLSNMVVWSKGGGCIGDLRHTFSTDYELALVFNRGAELCGKRIGSVWSFSKDAAVTYQHPTQKPVALAAEAIEKTTPAKSLVLDLFLGSGTTLIAAEQLGRRCYGIEISPTYCDVIVNQWENLTGKKAERVAATQDE